MTILNDDRLFPPDPATRAIARRLYSEIRSLPILSPHGHTNAQWFAEDQAFPDPARLFIAPDHYIYRMLYSQGVRLEDLGVGNRPDMDPRSVWRLFAKHYYLFRGTPTRMWLDYAFQEHFGLQERLSAENADQYFDTISERLSQPEFRPRALLEQFKIEVLATTDSPLDSLEHHKKIQTLKLSTRILPTFRPDAVVDPDFDSFNGNVLKLGTLSNEDTTSWSGYLAALRWSREQFKALGCTATDHGHPTVATADLDSSSAAALFTTVMSDSATTRGQGNVSRADAYRDGADEHGRWARHADPSRELPKS